MTALRALAESALPLVVSHLWSSTLFLLLILTLIAALRSRLTAGSRFSLALIGVVKFAIPAGVIVSPLRGLFRSSRPETIQIRLPLFAQQLSLGTTHVTPRLWPAVVVATTVAVAVLIMFRVALTNRRLASLCVKTAHPPALREVEALARARNRIGVRRSVDIARSGVSEAPAVLRVLRPLIVLPVNGCDDLSDQELESLLCHECAHIARHDNLVALVESFICALFWFHPLIWVAQRITAIERERACDEVVAGSADERDTYLAALTKFCHASISPRLPGVSCMATAKLSERIDHVMNFEAFKAHATSPRLVAVFGTATLALFTLVAGFAGTTSALASGAKVSNQPYAIRLEASRSGDLITLEASISDNATQQVIAVPKMTFHPGESATARASNSDVEVVIDVQPSDGKTIDIDAAITRDGKTVHAQARVSPAQAQAAPAAKYTGDPISMNLKDADLRDVILTFGKITGSDMRVDDSVHGTITVNWINVPWDQAFDALLTQHGLTYRIDAFAKTIYVTRK